MCGIAGFCDFNQDFLRQRERFIKLLIDMRSSIAHRGRDSSGEYLSKHTGFSHARLSIRDLTMGTRPVGKKSRRSGICHCI